MATSGTAIGTALTYVTCTACASTYALIGTGAYITVPWCLPNTGAITN